MNDATAAGHGCPRCPHGRCRAHDSCPACDRNKVTGRENEITGLLERTAADIAIAAERAGFAESAFAALTGSTRLFDEDLDESGDAADALDSLGQVLRGLRDVSRVISLWLLLISQPDVPEAGETGERES